MANQKDVADLAGVSFITVSRVINNKDNIKPETRKRVLDAIAELNYHPNSLARGLNRNRINSIGVATSLKSPQILVANSPYFHGLLNGIETSLMKHRYDLVISTRREESEGADYFRLFYERKVDGIILISTYLRDEHIREMVDNRIPCVVIGTRIENEKIICIDSDNYKAGLDLTGKLIGFGHSKIGFIHITEPNSNIDSRFEGFKTALDRSGLPFNEEWVFRVDIEDEEKAGREVMRTINTMPDPPTAVLASTDFFALGMIKEASEIGYPIPDQLSVAGFDGIDMGQVIQPSLMSAKQPLLTMGSTAADRLIQMINDPNMEKKSQIFPMSLVLGGSIAPPGSKN